MKELFADIYDTIRESGKRSFWKLKSFQMENKKGKLLLVVDFVPSAAQKYTRKLLC